MTLFPFTMTFPSAPTVAGNIASMSSLSNASSSVSTVRTCVSTLYEHNRYNNWVTPEMKIIGFYRKSRRPPLPPNLNSSQKSTFSDRILDFFISGVTQFYEFESIQLSQRLCFKGQLTGLSYLVHRFQDLVRLSQIDPLPISDEEGREKWCKGRRERRQEIIELGEMGD